MASYDRSSNLNSPSKMSSKWARKCERYCCVGMTYFPLFFVYSLTTWALWVETTIGFLSAKTSWVGSGTSCLGIVLYLLLNWCYTSAVFTSPGTTTSNNGYSSLPTNNSSIGTSFTVKANGELRYCKKCQARKPDRAHHCSTCRVCVLKMDHHCPWLATCVGLRNYKAFLLFLGYTTLFCLVCFGVSGFWVWREILSEGEYSESLMPINFVILAVISGIIGLLLAGFTGWHILLTCRGQTTIECLEKTRYLSSARHPMMNSRLHSQKYMQRTGSVHAEATGTVQPMYDPDSPGVQPGQRINYNEYERSRSRLQYEQYIDEQDSAKLPSAFDLGWKTNFLHLFGYNKVLWLFPVVTTIGDGWNWDPNPKWLQARERILQDREEQRQRENAAGWGCDSLNAHINSSDDAIYLHRQSRDDENSESTDPLSRTTSKADRILGRNQEYSDGYLLENLRSRSPSNYHQAVNTLDRQENRAFDRKSGIGWPQKVGVFTSTLFDNKFTKTNDLRGWDGRDEGVD